MFVLNDKGSELLEQFIAEHCVATGSAYFGLPKPKDRDFICTQSDYVDLWTDLAQRGGCPTRVDDPVPVKSGSESAYFMYSAKEGHPQPLPVNLIVLKDADTIACWIDATECMKELCENGNLKHVTGERTTRVNLFKELLAIIGSARYQNTMMVELEGYHKISAPLEF